MSSSSLSEGELSESSADLDREDQVALNSKKCVRVGMKTIFMPSSASLSEVVGPIGPTVVSSERPKNSDLPGPSGSISKHSGTAKEVEEAIRLLQETIRTFQTTLGTAVEKLEKTIGTKTTTGPEARQILVIFQLILPGALLQEAPQQLTCARAGACRQSDRGKIDLSDFSHFISLPP
uniref:BLOC-1-related complex subunit 5 n=1 Tax=Globodera pallida TaxID=36090 RepID=A0A183BLS2_GLOPA